MGIFYRIEGKDVQPSYLLGTHHNFPYETILQKTNLNEILPNLVGVAGEVNMQTVGQEAVKPENYLHLAAPVGKFLPELLTTEEYQEVINFFQSHHIEFRNDYNFLKPYYLKINIIEPFLSTSNPGSVTIDSFIQNRARDLNKQLKFLETVGQQYDFLYNSIDPNRQAEDLMEIIRNSEDYRNYQSQFDLFYSQFNPDAMLDLAMKYENPDWVYNITAGRNENWLKEIPSILAQGPYLIAVGALHLPGEKGLVKSLTDMGYKLTDLLPAVQ